MSLVYLIFYYSVNCCKNRAATQEAVCGSGSADHSNKCQQNKGRHRLPAISGRNNPPTTGHATMHMHDSTATEIASDSQSSKISGLKWSVLPFPKVINPMNLPPQQCPSRERPQQCQTWLIKCLNWARWHSSWCINFYQNETKNPVK